MRALALATIVLASAVVASAAMTGTAAAASAEAVTSYEIELTIDADGTVHATETIAYDFGANERHGIYRSIPSRVPAGDDRDRAVTVSNVEVSSPDGAPARFQVSESGDDQRIKIGDPDRTVTGTHTYVIGYDLDRALTSFADHEELYRDVIGDGWDVPISRATVTVRAPVGVTGATCFTGPTGSTESCTAATTSGTTARFEQAALAEHENLTVAVMLPKGGVAVPPPILVERRRRPGLLAGTIPRPAAVGGALAVLALIPLAWLYARPRRRTGTGTAGPGTAPTAPIPQPETAPPEGLHPAQAGALLAGRATSRHIVGELIGLAVRGYLRIEEDGTGKTPDWRLVRGRDPGPDLQPWEWTVLRALFTGRDVARLAELKYRFATTMKQARTQVMADAVRRGWYRRRPDTQRWVLAIAGFVLLAAGLALTAVLWLLGAGLVGVALMVTGVALPVIALVAVPRTAEGAELRRRVEAFRTHLASSGAGSDFSASLPYAVAFGIDRAWAARFADLTADPAPLGWYSGRVWPGDALFAAHLAGFTDTASHSLSVSPSSSSSGGSSGFSGGGFSGGGGGGGGGGSW